MADKPIPLIAKLPYVRIAPPIPMVSVTEIMIVFRVWFKFTLCCIRFCIPTEAMVPKSSNIMPPSTADGILCSKALSFPITEKTIAVAAEIRITCGWVIFVMLIAPVTSL